MELSSLNSKYIDNQNFSPKRQALPVSNVDNASKQTVLVKDTFKKKNKEAALIGALAGVLALGAGFIFLARKGKLGIGCKDFVDKIFNKFKPQGDIKPPVRPNHKDADKIKFFNDAGDEINVEFKKGMVYNPDRTKYTGVLSYKTKGNVKIENEYKNGLIQKSKRNGKLYRKYKRASYKNGGEVSYLQYDKKGKVELEYVRRKNKENLSIFEWNYKTDARKKVTVTSDRIITMTSGKNQNGEPVVKEYISKDIKSGKIIQRGVFSEQATKDWLGKKREGWTLLGFEDGNKKYYYEFYKPEFELQKDPSAARIPEIGLKPRGEGQRLPDLITENLHDGIIKYNTKAGAGFIFPGGETIRYNHNGLLDFRAEEFSDTKRLTAGLHFDDFDAIQQGNKTNVHTFGSSIYFNSFGERGDKDVVEAFLPVIKKFALDDKTYHNVINVTNKEMAERGYLGYANFGQWQDMACANQGSSLTLGYARNLLKILESKGL